MPDRPDGPDWRSRRAGKRLYGGLDVPAFLAHFDLAPAESARLADHQARLLALLC